MSPYIKYKIKVFSELHINLSEENIAHMEELKDKYKIDRYTHN